MPSGRWQTTTILVARGDETKVYSGPDDMPAPLRNSLDRALQGELSATIVIADSRGKDEVARMLRELKEAAERRELASNATRRFAWQFALVGMLALLGWAALTIR